MPEATTERRARDLLRDMRPGHKGRVLGVPVYATPDGSWDLWEPSICPCLPATYRYQSLDQAAALVAALRPGRPGRRGEENPK